MATWYVEIQQKTNNSAAKVVWSSSNNGPWEVSNLVVNNGDTIQFKDGTDTKDSVVFTAARCPDPFSSTLAAYIITIDEKSHTGRKVDSNASGSYSFSFLPKDGNDPTGRITIN